MEDERTTRFGIYPSPGREEFPLAEAGTTDAAMLAVRTLREDDETLDALGIWDTRTLTWFTYPWHASTFGISRAARERDEVALTAGEIDRERDDDYRDRVVEGEW